MAKHTQRSKQSAKKQPKNFLERTVIIKLEQSKKLSLNACKLYFTYVYFYNKGVEYGLQEKYTKIKIGYKVTEIRKDEEWCQSCNTHLERTAFQQGYDAIDKHLKSCKDKRATRVWAKKECGKNHNWYKMFKHLKANKHVDIRDIFKHTTTNGKHTSMAVNGQRPSLYVGKGKKLYMNLPGLGAVPIQSSLNNLPKEIEIEKIKSEITGKYKRCYNTNIYSYRLVETTKRFTTHITDSNRTFEIHLTVRVPKPEKTKRTKVIGLDAGVKKSVYIHNGKRSKGHETPIDCIRSPNDDISKQQAKRDKHVYKSNRWCKEDRILQNMVEKLNNKRTYHNACLAKLIIMMAGVLVMEKLNIRSMIAYNDKWSKGLNSAIHSAGMGKMGIRLKMTAENLGVKVFEIVPHYTSITCSKCNRINPNSRVSRDLFKCVYCKFKYHADKNAAKNIRAYGLPCIRRLPLINKLGKYKCESMDRIILANSINIGGIIRGGRGDRLKTGESKPGLYRVDPKNSGNNQAVEDSLDCQEKALVRSRDQSI